MSATHTEIVIVGAGLAGLGMAMMLRREGRDDFVVLERAGELGGTWRDNRYPGCACDIPSVLYSYRDEPNPGWTRAYAPQPEIRDYIDGVVARRGLDRFVRCDRELAAARWDEAGAVWQLDVRRPSDGSELAPLTATHLILATGALADPAIPALPGLEDFAGTTFHSARWNGDRSLSGRDVAVIGTGASAIQFVPEIQPAVRRLTVFQRTPPWVLPHQNPPLPGTWRSHLGRRPRLQEIVRGAVFSGQEALHLAFQHPRLAALVEWQGRVNIARGIADPDLRTRVTPDFRLGCKRILRSNTWYPALSAPNVEVVDGGVRTVVSDGVVDRRGVHHPADTIIFATGFRVTDQPIASRVHGRGGATLADAWHGSPRAHLGLAVRGFPNAFFLLGPNTGLGHNSVLLMIEAQIGYLRRLLAHAGRTGSRAVEVTARAQADWVAEVDRGMSGSVWTAGGCVSWYMDATGRNSALWPGSVRAYERRLDRMDPADYEWRTPRRTSPQPVGEPALT